MSDYAGVKYVVHVSTNVSTGCPHHCGAHVGGDHFAESINHFIKDHGYKILHVGTETSSEDDGKQWKHTVAVMGTKTPPKPKKEKSLEQHMRSRSRK